MLLAQDGSSSPSRSFASSRFSCSVCALSIGKSSWPRVSPSELARLVSLSRLSFSPHNGSVQSAGWLLVLSLQAAALVQWPNPQPADSTDTCTPDGIIYPIMVSRLIESHGFPAAVHWTGLLVGCCIAVGNLFAASPFKPKGFQERPAKNFAAFKSLPWISSSLAVSLKC